METEKIDVIDAYSREDALEDGVLVDISSFAREAGFKFPVAVTRELYDILEPSDKMSGQDFKGRAWDMFTVLRLAIRKASTPDRVIFQTLFLMENGKKLVNLKALCGPGDNMEPVITIMLENQD